MGDHPGKRNRESASTPQFDRSLILFLKDPTRPHRLRQIPFKLLFRRIYTSAGIMINRLW